MSSFSPMLSDASDGDVGIRAGLPSPPLLWPRPSWVVSSDSPSSGSMDYPASHVPIGSPSPVPRWRLAQEGSFLSEILPTDMTFLRLVVFVVLETQVYRT